MSSGRRPRRAALVLGALLAACAEGTPGDGGPGDTPRVALLCLDGLTFAVIDPLLERGRLPHMAALIERGARAALESFEDSPSPVVWATIATGTPPEVHGITGFSKRVPGRSRPVVFASTDRRVPALWELVCARGGTAGVVGFWNTWPAAPLDGYVVTDRFPRSLVNALYPQGEAGAVVHPPALTEELAGLLREPDAISREDLARLGAFTDAEWDVLLHLDDRGPVVGNGLVALKHGYQATMTVADVSWHLLASRPQPDLFVALLELPDRVGHHFWHAWRPFAVGEPGGVPVEWVERWGGVIPGAYELLDECVGRFVSALDAGTTILIVSDHGMQGAGSFHGSPDSLAVVGRSGIHHRCGVLIAAGPAIRRGGRDRATLYDVTPTVLAALGLPGSRQARGRVLTGLLDAAFLARHPLQEPVAEPDRAADPAEPAAGIEDRYVAELQAIGYLDAAGGPADVGGTRSSVPGPVTCAVDGRFGRLAAAGDDGR